ncbi:nitrogen regulation protein NR(II) [Halobaculum halobium]|uniref:histidine kinase n=1 Tax=Halobaculum halobium TaxID=3032281 RepID=A0ABD5TEH0_9EURY|nr:PAS domain-containing sensor histidine kinase [Halobaculum sp. SYNS20]
MDSEPVGDLSPLFFTELVETVGVGVAVYGDDGSYVYVNEAYADFFGVDSTELVGTPLWDIVPRIDADQFDRYWASFEVGETRSTETVHEYNGTTVPVDTITTRRIFDGTAYHFGTIKDISERKEREREISRQNERLDDFARVVSHDLRNPLNIAQGYLDILTEDVDRDELALAINSLDRMDTLITELLTLAKSGDGIGDTEQVSVSEVAEAAWNTVSTGAADIVYPDRSVAVIADRSRLQQLFENLFRNAIEHGGERTTVTVETRSDGFSVADDGVGIPVEERETVFDTGYTTVEDGTGFGLNIVEEVATAHGWSVEITESAGGGARFDISGVEFAD